MADTTNEAMGRALARLGELAAGWGLELTHADGEWRLKLTPRNYGLHTHEYHSTDLVRLINHAWAGAPDGKV